MTVKSMSGSKIRNGYFSISNELAEVLARTNIPGNQMRILWVVLRLTTGWNKSCDWISLTQFERRTSMNRRNVSRSIKALVAKRLLLKRNNAYIFNQNFQQWQVAKRLPVGANMASGRGKYGKKVGVKRLPTKDIFTKNNYTKDSVPQREEVSLRLFHKWNESSVMVHKSFDKFQKHINAALDIYTEDELIKAIENYAFILKSDRHYWSYRWSLDQFLSRKNGIDRFLPVNFKEVEYRISSKADKHDIQKEIDQKIQRALSNIATKAMIKKLMMEIPKEYRYRILKYLERRYSDGGKGYYEAEREIIAESRQTQEKISKLTESVCKK